MEDSIAAKHDKLESLLTRVSGAVGASAPLIAELLSLPVEKRYGTADLTAPQRRERLVEALINQVE